MKCYFKKTDYAYEMILPDRFYDTTHIRNIFNQFYCTNRLINIINAAAGPLLTYSYHNSDKTNRIYTWKTNNNHNQSKISITVSNKVKNSRMTLSFVNTNNDDSSIMGCNTEILKQLQNSTDIVINNNFTRGDDLLMDILKK